MLKTHELVEAAIGFHVLNEIGDRTEMSEYARNQLANKIVDEIDPDGNLEYVAPYKIHNSIGEQAPNVHLSDLIKDMVRRELWEFTIRLIERKLDHNRL